MQTFSVDSDPRAVHSPEHLRSFLSTLAGQCLQEVNKATYVHTDMAPLFSGPSRPVHAFSRSLPPITSSTARVAVKHKGLKLKMPLVQQGLSQQPVPLTLRAAHTMSHRSPQCSMGGEQCGD